MKEKTDDLASGLYPFWFWNSELDEDEIRWQIDEMANKGIKGFFIHSRQGLKQPYLSDSFFKMVETAIRHADSRHMVVHLYDEYPYPSGIAGGEVTLGSPQFYATYLAHRRFDVSGGKTRLELPRGKVLACVAYPIKADRVQWRNGLDLRKSVGVVLVDDSYLETGLTMYSQKRYFASAPTPILEAVLDKGKWRIFASVQCVLETHKYWSNFVDVLNPEAIREFLKLTHERYYSRFGKDFGRSVYSIFVDETEGGWSPLVPERFRQLCGYDIISMLPALQDSSHPEHLKVRYDLEKVVYRMFCESFEEQVAGWCKGRGIKYSGEKPAKRFSQLEYMDIPGCDPGHTKAGAEKTDVLKPALRKNARGCASAAYFYDKEGALAECFHSMGWSSTLLDARIVGEELLLMGIRYLVPHGFFYSTHGLLKHDAPPSFFFQMPYWPMFGHLSRRFSRVAERLEKMNPWTQILIVDPNSGLPTQGDSEAFEALLHALLAEHLDFMMVDTDVLQSGSVENGCLNIKDITAELVIVPPMQIVEEPLKRWLGMFEKKDGVVFGFKADDSKDDLIDRISRVVAPSLEMRSRSGDTARLHVVTKTDGSRKLWYVINTSGKDMEIELAAGSSLVEIALDDSAPSMLQKEAGRYSRRVRPFESFMLESTDEPESRIIPEVVRIPLGGRARVKALNKNLVRMYDWQMTLVDRASGTEQSAVVPAVTVAIQLDRGRFKIAPAMMHCFGRAPQMMLPELDLRYSYTFENAYDGRVELVMERGTLVGTWRIEVNDGKGFGADAFKATDAHVRGSLGTDITHYLRQGRNEIVVYLKTARLDGGLINALYLAGDFGVGLNPVRLVSRSMNGGFDTWKENGLPYYAGVVEYDMEFELSGLPADPKVTAELDFPAQYQDACEVSINGGPLHPIPWLPGCVLLDTKELKKGTNRLKIRSYTTLIRSFEGQWFDVINHCYRRIE